LSPHGKIDLASATLTPFAEKHEAVHVSPTRPILHFILSCPRFTPFISEWWHYKLKWLRFQILAERDIM